MGHDRARAAYRRAVAVELRTQGHSYAEIAEILEFRDRSGAWRCVMRALEGRELTAADRYRVIRLSELEHQHRAAWLKAKGGDFAAIDTVLRAADERIKLLQIS
jgi:hypothetical protein